jgi:hypothetical protein
MDERPPGVLKDYRVPLSGGLSFVSFADKKPLKKSVKAEKIRS